MNIWKGVSLLLGVVHRMADVEDEGGSGEDKQKKVVEFAAEKVKADHLVEEDHNPGLGQVLAVIEELIPIIVSLFNLIGAFKKGES